MQSSASRYDVQNAVWLPVLKVTVYVADDVYSVNYGNFIETEAPSYAFIEETDSWLL